MRRCPTCGHENLPSFQACSRCGASLQNVANVGADDDVARLMASRAAAQKRNRTVVLGVGIVAVAVVGWKMMQDRRNKAAMQEKLSWVDKWYDLDKRETGAFWSCVMGSEVNIDMFANAGQIQQKIESAYATQPKTFSDHLLTECVPKIERARQAFGSLDNPHAEFTAALDKYKAALPKLQEGVESYADRIKNRGEQKDVDKLIQEMGDAWHANTSATPETIAFHKFLTCAVPNLGKLKDAQALLEFLADACFKKDPVAFMTNAREKCGQMLTPVPGDKAPGDYAATVKKFYEEEARQLRAWEDCGRKSRKGRKVDDLEDLLVAGGGYMEARAEVGKAAKAVRDSGE